MKIFWSWQSDTHGKTGRHFVRETLEAVIAELKESVALEESVREALDLDHDSKGVAGSPDIIATILKKIEESAVFIADVTTVGEVTIAAPAAGDKKPKKLLNSNVAIELGYALKALPETVILMVMNLEYGTQKDLPFDLQNRRFPITFKLARDADAATIAAERKALKASLLTAIGACLQQTPAPTPAYRPTFGEAAYTESRARFSKRDEVLASFNGEQEFTIDFNALAYLRFFPKYGDQPKVGNTKLKEVFEGRRVEPFVYYSNPSADKVIKRNDHGYISFQPLAATSIVGLTQGFASGELWGVNSKFAEITNGLRGQLVYARAILFEVMYAKAIRNYFAVATKAFQLKPPFTVEFGVANVRGLKFVSIDGYESGEIRRDNFFVRSEITTEKDAEDALREYLNDLYDLAESRRDEMISSSVAAGHQLPPL